MLSERLTTLDSLKERLRFGLISVDKVKQASQLGHPLARDLFPNEALVDWSDWESRTDFIRGLGKLLCVRFMIACTEKLLPAFEAKFPESEGLRRALAAAKARFADPTDSDSDSAWATEHATDSAWAAVKLAAASYEWQKETLATMILE